MNADNSHSIKAPGPALTKRAMMLAQVESDFTNHAMASMIALKEIARRSLAAATSHGVQSALDVFARAVDAKISALQQAMRAADNAWDDLADFRREASQMPGTNFSASEIGLFAVARSRARLNEMAEQHASAIELLRRMVEVSGLYMKASLQVTQSRSEIAGLINGASLFLTEQVGASSPSPSLRADSPLSLVAVDASERDRLTVVPKEAVA